MRILLVLVMLGGLLLPAAPASALGGGDDETRCEQRARSLEFLETAQQHFEQLPGFFGELLARWFGYAAERAAWRYADACVHLNEVQQLGSHNSYHIEPEQVLIDLYKLFRPDAIGWQYTHRPLDEQFSMLGIRQIELDVYADPEGGMYESPGGLQILLDDSDVVIPGMDLPGTKVLHVQDLDWQTTCEFFVECLQQVLAWSSANPGHLPLMILVEAKDEPLPSFLQVPPPIEWGAVEFDQLEDEILSVFPIEHIITPDDVRGGELTLEGAVLANGWPTLGEARGKVLFGLDNRGKRDIYLDGHPSLAGRLLFTDGNPGEDDAAFIKRNGPIGNEAEIQDLIAQGYIVRTRADGDTDQSRDNDPTQRDAALASAGTYVSTDYAEPNLDFSPYMVAIPGGEIARCNPVNGPPGCRDFALER